MSELCNQLIVPVKRGSLVLPYYPTPVEGSLEKLARTGSMSWDATTLEDREGPAMVRVYRAGDIEIESARILDNSRSSLVGREPFDITVQNLLGGEYDLEEQLTDLMRDFQDPRLYVEDVQVRARGNPEGPSRLREGSLHFRVTWYDGKAIYVSREERSGDDVTVQEQFHSLLDLPLDNEPQRIDYNQSDSARILEAINERGPESFASKIISSVYDLTESR